MCKTFIHCNMWHVNQNVQYCADCCVNTFETTCKGLFGRYTNAAVERSDAAVERSVAHVPMNCWGLPRPGRRRPDAQKCFAIVYLKAGGLLINVNSELICARQVGD